MADPKRFPDTGESSPPLKTIEYDGRDTADETVAAGAPQRIGPYQVLEVLGEGGMGVVYLAEQKEPVRRRVALKLIKLGMDTKDVIARFESERQALALMSHPHVAAVLDAGATEHGRPYFVMEYVPGIPIQQYCDKHRMSVRERLELFVHVCEAVQHAHQKGIIHRDLKPSNVLVMLQDGRPLPKVIDFGVAKATAGRLTDRTLYTEQGRVIGTPGYMSPEQAEMTALDIDTRTDVYSLGMMLYELLVGALPFDPKALKQAGYAEMQRIIREQEAPKPSTKLSELSRVGSAYHKKADGGLSTADGGQSPPYDYASDVAHKRHEEPRTLMRQVKGDLDWICLKAIEKDRTRRYQTPTEFAADIRRHLNQEPVLACPPSWGYRLNKFVRRNKLPVCAAAAVLVALAAGLVATTLLYLEADTAKQAEADQRKIADEQRADAEEARDQAKKAAAAEAEQRKIADEGREDAEKSRDQAKKTAAMAEAINERRAERSRATAARSARNPPQSPTARPLAIRKHSEPARPEPARPTPLRRRRTAPARSLPIALRQPRFPAGPHPPDAGANHPALRRLEQARPGRRVAEETRGTEVGRLDETVILPRGDLRCLQTRRLLTGASHIHTSLLIALPVRKLVRCKSRNRSRSRPAIGVSVRNG